MSLYFTLDVLKLDRVCCFVARLAQRWNSCVIYFSCSWSVPTRSSPFVKGTIAITICLACSPHIARMCPCSITIRTFGCIRQLKCEMGQMDAVFLLLTQLKRATMSSLLPSTYKSPPWRQYNISTWPMPVSTPKSSTKENWFSFTWPKLHERTRPMLHLCQKQKHMNSCYSIGHLRLCALWLLICGRSTNRLSRTHQLNYIKCTNAFRRSSLILQLTSLSLLIGKLGQGHRIGTIRDKKVQRLTYKLHLKCIFVKDSLIRETNFSISWSLIKGHFMWGRFAQLGARSVWVNLHGTDANLRPDQPWLYRAKLLVGWKW